MPPRVRMLRISSCYHGPVRRGSRGGSRIFAAGAAFAVACAGPANEAVRERAAVRSEPPHKRSGLVEAARSWPRAVAPFASRGHGDGSYVIDIRVSPESVDAVRTLVLGRTVPIGAGIVAFHSRHDSNALESIFAMSKAAEGKWDFLVADPRGNVVSEGPLPLCARCHADAPADSVFVPDALAKPAVPGPSDAGH